MVEVITDERRMMKSTNDAMMQLHIRAEWMNEWISDTTFEIRNEESEKTRIFALPKDGKKGKKEMGVIGKDLELTEMLKWAARTKRTK